MGRSASITFEGPVEVRCRSIAAGMELFFQRQPKRRETGAVCARCAEEFDATSDRPFRFVLLAQGGPGYGDDPLRAEDLEFSLYEGDQGRLEPAYSGNRFCSPLPTRPLWPGGLPRSLPALRGQFESHPMRMPRRKPSNPRLEALRSLKNCRAS